MRVFRRKQRLGMSNPQATPNPFVTLSHEALVEAGKAAGFPPFCGTWPRETLIQKLMENAHAV